MKVLAKDKKRIINAVNSVIPKSKAISEFGLVFVSAEKMKELNQKYRRKNYPTNVLSFAYGDPALERDKFHLAKTISFKGGDVVICPEAIKEEAKKYGFTQKNWMTRLIVHGILHIIVYRHGAAMERLEKKVFEKLGI